MVRTMIKKTDFIPYAKVGENIYKLMFGREDVEQNVIQENDESEQVPIGVKEPTDYCIVTLEVFYYKPSAEYIVKMLAGNGIVNMSEAETILSNFSEDILPYLRTLLLHNVELYDTSPAVKSFSYGAQTEWFLKEKRVGLVNSITTEKNAGKEMTALWLSGEKYVLPVDTALQMLAALELYSLECYNVTEEHKAAVRALENVEDIIAYDYTANYPNKLIF